MPQPQHLIISGIQVPQIPLKKPYIHHLPDLEFIEKIREYNGIPSYVIENKELIDIFLPMIHADFCISETYKYYDESPLACSIIALRCLSDNIFDTQNLLQTSSSFQYELIPRDHFFIKSSHQKIISIVNKIIDKEITKCNNYK